MTIDLLWDPRFWTKLAHGLTLALRPALVLMLCASLTTCASGRSHQNFKNTMQSDIGRGLDDPYIYRNRNSNLRVATRTLSTGNVEEEFKGGLKLNCRVFFEIDQTAGKVVGWRYEGSEEDCAITP